MHPDNPPPALVSAKRSHDPTESTATESKKLKTEQRAEAPQGAACVDHVKEIERLKELISQRDEEISSLHKIIAALTRKQGL